MRILITGAAGQLGQELAGILASGKAEIGQINPMYRGAEVTCASSSELDIADEVRVDGFFDANHIDLCFNCAAYTNVDACETNRDCAYQVNAIGPQNLARACSRTGAKLVHVSTDYVFSGDEDDMRAETDPVAPISVYGKTKLEGEKFVFALNPNSFVVRTAWLYGHAGRNFVKTMLSLAEQDKTVTVVNDQYGNPTSANDLAYSLLRLASTDDFGLYHCTNNGTCSWFDFACAIFQMAGYDSAKVMPCSSEEYARAHPNAARRPRFSALRNEHLESTIGDSMRSWQDALEDYLSRSSV